MDLDRLKQAVAQQNNAPNKRPASTDEKIIRQSCLKCAVEHCNHQVGPSNTDDVLRVAAEFEKWVQR